MKKGLIIVLAVAFVIGIGLGFVVFTEQEEAPQIPGITAENPWPKGCVNCHKQVGDPAEPQTKLSIKLKAWAKGAPAELVELLQKAAPEGWVGLEVQAQSSSNIDYLLFRRAFKIPRGLKFIQCAGQ